jgi:hypothetical protein
VTDFQSDRIISIRDARRLAHTLSEPASSDHHENDGRRAQPLLHNSDEVVAQINAGHVHEDETLAEACSERIVQPSGIAGSVVATIADEDTGHRSVLPQL